MSFDKWKRANGSHKWRRESDADATWCTKCLERVTGEDIMAKRAVQMCVPTPASISRGSARLAKERDQFFETAQRVADKMRLPVSEVLAAWEEQA